MSSFLFMYAPKTRKRLPNIHMETMTENKHHKKREIKPFSIYLGVLSGTLLAQSGWLGRWQDNFCHVELTDQLFLTPTFSTSQCATGNTNGQNQNYTMDTLSLAKCGPELTSSIPIVTIYIDQQQEIINVCFCSQLRSR